MTDEFLQFDLPHEQSAIIKVLGVGGGGSNAVNHMYKKGIKDVDFVVCNTDAQALASSPVPIKIQLGASLTEGRGAGNKPEIGRQAAIENLDDIVKVLSSNTKMIFITAGMGGGTGTGAAPVISKAAKELGILTVAIVTLPFRFEGQRRIQQAIEGINNIAEHVDSLLLIDNEKLMEITKTLTFTNAFAEADDILLVAAKGIAEIITINGKLNVDFADVQTVMTNSGVSLMGSSLASGPDRAITAIKNALTSPLLNNNDIHGAKNILLNITSGTEEVTMGEIEIINQYVQKASGNNADLIWGHNIDEKLGDKVSVTVIATGFQNEVIPGIQLLKNSIKTTKSEDKNAEIEKRPEKVKEIEVKAIKSESYISDFEKKNDAIEFEIDNRTIPIQKHNDENLFFNPPGIQIENLNFPENDLTTEDFENYTLSKKSLEKVKFNPSKYQENLDKIESEPAFIRQNIKLAEINSSISMNISKYELKLN